MILNVPDEMESDKAEQTRKDVASTFIAELASIKQDDFDAYVAATNISGETDDAEPSPDRAESGYQGLDPASTTKILFPFVSTDKPISASSK